MVFLFFIIVSVAFIMHLAEAAPAPQQIINPQGVVDLFTGLWRILRKQLGLISV